MRPIYLCSRALAEQVKIQGRDTVFGHEYNTTDGITILWPDSFHESCISPESFLLLKEFLKTEEIFVVDRVSSINRAIKISDHTNRSGKSFLRAKTPYKELPTFPDVSNIYVSNAGETVTTVGPGRFGEERKNKHKLISEALAPITVVWHYVGMKLIAFGCPQTLSSVSRLIREIERIN